MQSWRAGRHQKGVYQDKLALRPGRPEDAPACGRICYEAFKTIAEAHNFTPDFPSPDIATGLLSWMLSHPNFYSVIAELDGRIVGSNFLDERTCIAGVGPITVEPAVQNRRIGRQLMEKVHERVAQRNLPGVRLLQSGYHTRSLSLYAKLGYEVREPLACMQGAALSMTVPGYTVRPAGEPDLEACGAVCHVVHGHDRNGELLDAIKEGSATLVEHDGHFRARARARGKRSRR